MILVQAKELGEKNSQKLFLLLLFFLTLHGMDLWNLCCFSLIHFNNLLGAPYEEPSLRYFRQILKSELRFLCEIHEADGLDSVF